MTRPCIVPTMRTFLGNCPAARTYEFANLAAGFQWDKCQAWHSWRRHRSSTTSTTGSPFSVLIVFDAIGLKEKQCRWWLMPEGAPINISKNFFIKFTFFRLGFWCFVLMYLMCKILKRFSRNTLKRLKKSSVNSGLTPRTNHTMSFKIAGHYIVNPTPCHSPTSTSHPRRVLPQRSTGGEGELLFGFYSTSIAFKNWRSTREMLFLSLQNIGFEE